MITKLKKATYTKAVWEKKPYCDHIKAKQRKCKITPDLIREAKQFKPAIGAYTWEADSTSPSKPDKETK